jgi:hypothetical protein
MIVPFPGKEYQLLQRREDYVEALFESVCATAWELNMDLEPLEYSGAVFAMIRELVDEHLWKN